MKDLVICGLVAVCILACSRSAELEAAKPSGPVTFGCACSHTARIGYTVEYNGNAVTLYLPPDYQP